MKKPAILITERDEPLRRRMKALMLHHGCEVIEASKATEALQAFHHGHVDLMLLDTCLEVPWDGVELVQQIRQLGSKIALIQVTWALSLGGGSMRVQFAMEGVLPISPV
jgi:DNA-binding response OmpR family regulator